MVLPIFIVEDNPAQREQLNVVVKDYIGLVNHMSEIVLSTGNPTELLEYLHIHQPQRSLYFLDVDLSHELNGIALATEIRALDKYGKIVFITAHAELAPLTFRHRTEAMDYIVKATPNEMATSIHECMDIAYKHFMDTTSEVECFQIKTKTDLWDIPIDDIMFFESHHKSHKLILHTKNKWVEFYGSLSDIAEYNPSFQFCHRNFVLNVRNVRSVDRVNRTVEMANGEVIPLSVRKAKELTKLISLK